MLYLAEMDRESSARSGGDPRNTQLQALAERYRRTLRRQHSAWRWRSLTWSGDAPVAEPRRTSTPNLRGIMRSRRRLHDAYRYTTVTSPTSRKRDAADVLAVMTQASEQAGALGH